MTRSPSDRTVGIVLLAAAALGLAVASSPAGPAVLAAAHTPVTLGLDADHLISEGLLAIFFLLIAIELRRELTHGALAHPAAAALPVVAAAGGVLAPALLYLLAAPEAARGWPIPVATDVAFALGLLALVGRRFPPRVRAFLLALAIVDDLIAVLLIAVVFPATLRPAWLLPAVALVAVFAVLARLPAPPVLRGVLLWLVGLAVWTLALRGGVHATLAAVACGLALPDGPARTADRVLQPVSRLLVLPVFACSAALVRIVDPGPDLFGPVFVAVAVALPVGKLVGIAGGGLLGAVTVGRRAPERLRFRELVAVGLLGGIGFTVSLLMARLAFGDARQDAATLGVLAGSAIAMVVSAALVPLLARRR